MTVWRPVVGFEGCYEVSDHGQVRSLDRTIVTHTKHGEVRRRLAGKIMKQHLGAAYLEVTLSRGNEKTLARPHRLVLEAFVGPCPEGMETRHFNGNPLDNRLENLLWGTPVENASDCTRHGTHSMTVRRACPRGHGFEEFNLVGSTQKLGYRQCWACKLSDSEVRAARKAGREVDFATRADEFYAKLRGGWRPQPWRGRTHCLRQHPLAEPNLCLSELKRRGVRACLACHRASRHADRLRARGRVVDFQALSDSYYAEIADAPASDVDAAG